jgi:hypothetical protein
MKPFECIVSGKVFALYGCATSRVTHNAVGYAIKWRLFAQWQSFVGQNPLFEWLLIAFIERRHKTIKRDCVSTTKI